MTRKQIVKSSFPSQQEVRAIKQLQQTCERFDNFNIKLYWNVIEDRKTSNFDDFFYYVDGNLVGYLALFGFSIHEVEVSGFVHPKYRNQGIFTSLLNEAWHEFSKRYLQSCLFICNRASANGLRYLQRYQPELIQSVCEMTLVHDVARDNLPAISLKACSIDDVATMASMDIDLFDASFERKFALHFENMKERGRKAWFAYNAATEPVGKMHVRFDSKTAAFMHDLGILSKFRDKKYGKAMVLKTIDLLKSQGVKKIALDVLAHNETAIMTYKRCGFDITAIYDFLRVKFQKN